MTYTCLLDMYNETMKGACLNGPGLPIIQNVGGKRLLFKNIACLHCNMGADFTGNPNSCGYYEYFNIQNEIRYSISFN